MGQRRGEYVPDPKMFVKRDPARPRIPLADNQFYFAQVEKRAARYLRQAVEAADHFAKRNPTAKDPALVELRAQWFALEAAAWAVEARVQRLEREAEKRVEAAASAPAVGAADASKVIA